MAIINIDLTQVEDTAFPQIEPGRYPAMVTDSEIKPNKKENGLVLHITFTILEGRFKNFKVRDFLNIKNASKDAENIGRAQFKKLCESVGIINQIVNETNEIHARPLYIHVDQDGEYTRVKKYEPVSREAVEIVKAKTPEVKSKPRAKKNKYDEAAEQARSDYESEEHNAEEDESWG